MRGVQWQVGVSSLLVNLMLFKQINPVIKIMVCLFEHFMILIQLGHHEISHPRLVKFQIWLMSDVSLELNKPRVNPVVRVPNERSQKISMLGFWQAQEVSASEVLMDDSVQIWVEAEKSVVCAFVESRKPLCHGLARRFPRQKHDEFF
jgi:hypothetical protein